LKEHLVLKDSATPATVWHYVRGTRGAIYGPESTPELTGPRRFMPPLGIPGLYLTGASVTGPGIMACVLGGLLSARYCARHLSTHSLAKLSVPLRIVA
jgi:phytoene dehydrogenase-like protein